MSPPQTPGPRAAAARADAAEQRFRALCADVQRARVLGIARNCLLTAHRGRGRREALAGRVADAGDAATTTPHDGLVAGLALALAAAWRRLAPRRHPRRRHRPARRGPPGA